MGNGNGVMGDTEHIFSTITFFFAGWKKSTGGNILSVTTPSRDKNKKLYCLFNCRDNKNVVYKLGPTDSILHMLMFCMLMFKEYIIIHVHHPETDEHDYE